MVTVNDRGPFAINDKGKVVRPLKPHPIRIIDLTPTAFKTLTGDLDLGVINVRVVAP